MDKKVNEIICLEHAQEAAALVCHGFDCQIMTSGDSQEDGKWYFAFLPSKKLKTVIAKYDEGKIGVNLKEYIDNIHMLNERVVEAFEINRNYDEKQTAEKTVADTTAG